MRDPADSDTVRINPVTLTFEDPALERRFRDEYDRRSARTGRFAILLGAPGYVLMLVILDDAGARRAALAMVLLLAVWIAVAWTPLYAAHYQGITVVAESVLSALSMVVLLELPGPSSVVIAIAFITMNLSWITVILRPRFPYAVATGTGYLALVIVGGSVVWDRFGQGAAPEGMVSWLGGRTGGALIVFLYAGFLLALTSGLTYRLERADRVGMCLRDALAEAHERSERLLTNILPVPIAQRLKEGESPIADDHAEVSVVFADIEGFTAMAAALDAGSVVQVLNEVFSRFDDLAARHGLEKIKTIGDSYMAVAGAPDDRAGHACAAADMALDMLDALEDVRWPDGSQVTARIGISSGAAVAGVIGSRKFAYDIWGDTVNVASRMETQGLPGCVHVSDVTRRLLGDGYDFEDRGVIDVKGKGQLHTWILRRSSASPPLVCQDPPPRGGGESWQSVPAGDLVEEREVGQVGGRSAGVDTTAVRADVEPT